MATFKCITLEELKEHENEEYKTLKFLNELYSDAIKQSSYKEARSLASSIKYQRGKWGMLMNLIEELENNNE